MSKPRVLVTGASGFTGHYVCKELEQQGFEVVALTQDGSLDGERVDICSYKDVLKCISYTRPESVIHLAAIAYVAHGAPNDFYRVNVEGTLNLLMALEATNCIYGTVVLTSSANIYGNAYQDRAITEDCAPQPVNDYAVSKLSMEYMSRLHMDKLPMVIVRPFNYTGLGQNDNFLVPKIVKAFKERREVLELGNLNVSRDFSDVRDIAKYYARIVTMKMKNQTLNLCSGRSVKIKEIIRICECVTGHKLEVKSLNFLKRESELMRLKGNPKQLMNLCDYKPKHTIEQTLSWMLRA